MKKGIVFDIQRFSTHDGPGIRTTVFLKGCPLRCIWCHNPESYLLKPQLSYKKDNCRNCLSCLSVCPTGAHMTIDKVHTIEYTKCRAHFSCVKVCPYQALKVIGEEIDSETVIKEVEADLLYYQNSGGGMTISGGEPMLQYEFTLELLKSAKSKGIHTCIETSGYADSQKYEEICEYTDLFLFDIKASGLDEHKKLTGVDNRIILSNLDFLYNKGAGIILRCPLIPGINDTEHHLYSLAELERKYPNLQAIEILPYHDTAKGKWEEIGSQYDLKHLSGADKNIKSIWMEKFKALGCKKVNSLL